MQHNHTPLSYSKGLFLGKKIHIYKHLVKKLLPEENAEDNITMPTYEEGATPLLQSRQRVQRSFTPADGVIYTSHEVGWRTKQLPKLIWNI